MIKFKHWKGILLSFIFFTSLIISRQYTDPFFTPKNIFFIFSASVFIIIASLNYFKTKYELETSVNLIDTCVIIFMLWFTIRLIFTEDMPWNNNQYLLFLFCTFIYFITKPILFSKNKLETHTINSVLTIVLLIGLVQVIWGALQYAGVLENYQKEFRIGSAFGNPGAYANFITPIFGYALAIFFFSKKNTKTLGLIGSISILLILPFTQARTAWISTAIIIFYLLQIKYSIISRFNRLINNKLIRILTIVLVLGLTIVASVFLYNHKKASASGRIFIWQVSAKMIADKPLTGFGFDRFSSAHNNYQAEYFESHPNDNENAFVADGVNYAFNEWIHVAVEAGIPGALCLLALFIFSFLAKLRKGADETQQLCFYGAKAALIAIAISALFSYPLHLVSTLALMFFSLSIISILSEGYNWKFSVKPGKIKIFIIVLLLFTGIVFMENYKRYKAEKKWLEAFQYMRQGNINDAYNLYTVVYDDLSYNPFFLFNFGAELNLMKRYDESIKVLKSVESRLNDSDFYIYLGNDYESLGKLAEAEACYLR